MKSLPEAIETTPYDSADYMKSPEEVALFLRETADLIGDAGALKSVMRAAARALEALPKHEVK